MSNPARQHGTLIDGYVHGDSSALRTVHRWIDVVLQRNFRSLAGDWDDLRQEARTRVFRNLSRGQFRAEAELRTYVHQITKNVCVDHVRGARREASRRAASLEPGAAVTPSDAARHLARDLLDRILRGLSRRDRRLLYLVHVECRSYAEVARELGISEGAVKLRMFRCRQRILKRRRRLIRPMVGD